ncbi:speriolin-like protein [Maylandia zebra]|uniref:Speriolin-like protein n=1 Tax=Pundamilia nyererei TaxID=303518 RepID=A0A9Y3RER9_9CICH|nr:speriolin-like protein [Maylandia zebra]XP_005738547.1 PREDICTED: speriolin-like protein [Pundamilia nyererei]XP_026041631.1 speriolin-like protein [Astatotilapia calliptera]
MNLEQTAVALRLKNDQLRQDNDQLKSILSVVKENIDLRARMESFNKDTLEELTVCSISGTEPLTQWQRTFDEKQFRKDLQQTKPKWEHRSSSPIDFKSFIQSSLHTDADETAERHSRRTDVLLDSKAPNRLLGEICYQLDRRILSYIFQGHTRLYGFIMANIPNKIIEVSTHPLTGKVDQGYQLHLTQRHAELVERLSQRGYKEALHPPFTEFIVNTYGILTERPSEHSTQEMDYNNPDFLKKVIMTTAPRKLHKDLLVVLTCLCMMAEMDRKPLLFW